MNFFIPEIIVPLTFSFTHAALQWNIYGLIYSLGLLQLEIPINFLGTALCAITQGGFICECLVISPRDLSIQFPFCSNFILNEHTIIVESRMDASSVIEYYMSFI